MGSENIRVSHTSQTLSYRKQPPSFGSRSCQIAGKDRPAVSYRDKDGWIGVTIVISNFRRRNGSLGMAISVKRVEGSLPKMAVLEVEGLNSRIFSGASGFR